MTTFEKPGRSILGAVLQASRWLLVIAAIPLSAVGAAVALVTAVAVSGNRALAAVAGALAVVLVTGGLSWLTARGISRRRQFRRWLPGAATAVTMVAVATVIGLAIFAPAPTYTPLTATDDTRYWDLPTGSRIAYTHTPAQGTPQPTPVILVHGGPGAPEGGLELVTATLADAGFDVYDYHQVGAGRSERLEDVAEYTVARHVADLEAIRRAIGAERVVLVGESWGGTLIAHYLERVMNFCIGTVVCSYADSKTLPDRCE